MKQEENHTHQDQCLGCKRYFITGEKLPLENMTVELKNYPIPMKQPYLKNVILKTIVAFLNSKGGYIFIGVNDANGEVQGITLIRKQMDQFKLVMQQTIQRIHPAVDLVNHQQVEIHYVPVLEDQEKNFYGKFVVKFVVKQGDPSKLYCLSEVTRNFQSDQVQIITSFRRHNLGGIQSIKGIRVVNQIYEKARNPHRVATTFHDNCNPQPANPVQIQRQKNQKLVIKMQQQVNVQSRPSPKDSKMSKEQSINKSSSLSFESQNQPGQIASQSQQSGVQTLIQKLQLPNDSYQTPQFVQQNSLQRPLQNGQQKPRLHQQKASSQSSFTQTLQVYFSNIKQQFYQSLSKFIQNSTSPKYTKTVSIGQNYVKIRFLEKEHKELFMVQVNKPAIKLVLDGFAKNNKINITFNHYSLTNDRGIYTNAKNQHNAATNIKHVKEENTNNLQPSLIISFRHIQQKFYKSLQNYLKNCLNRNYIKKMDLFQRQIQLAFEKQSQGHIFYKSCTHPPHINQLRHYGNKKGLKIEIKGEKHKQSRVVKHEQAIREPQKKLKTNQMPLIIKQIPSPPQTSVKKVSQQSQLIISSIQPCQLQKLSNYLANCMFFNIQKTLYPSKNRFCLRVVFKNSKDCLHFLYQCKTQPHIRLLPQFTSTKIFRIGFVTDTLLITPYNQKVRQKLKQIILETLGQGAIKKSNVIQQNNSKIWALQINNAQKLIQYYQKLEEKFRPDPLIINQQWIKFKVYLDYKPVNF